MAAISCWLAPAGLAVPTRLKFFFASLAVSYLHGWSTNGHDFPAAINIRSPFYCNFCTVITNNSLIRTIDAKDRANTDLSILAIRYNLRWNWGRLIYYRLACFSLEIVFAIESSSFAFVLSAGFAMSCCNCSISLANLLSVWLLSGVGCCSSGTGVKAEAVEETTKSIKIDFRGREKHRY